MSILTACKRKLAERRGFSLAEVLLAVAILVILLALLIPNLIKTQKDLRQKELDAKAEIIYVAAQNQLAKLRAGGNAQLYQSAAAYRLPDCPSDAIPPRDESGSIRNNYYYLSSAELTADSAVMNPDVVDPALLGANWIIEYQPEYGKVHAVFYWETKKNNFFTYLTEAFSNNPDLRDRSQRFRAKNAGLGYYGGDESRSDTGASVSLSPQITLNRGEVLSAQLYCEKPRSSEELTFEFTVFDEFGHAYTQKFFKNQQNIYGLSCSVTVTLDDLSDTNTRFEQLYGSNSGHNEGEKLVAGSKLTFRLTVRGKSGTVEPGTVEDNVGANSLFDDRSDHSTAVITCGRHLQNLDESSGLNKHLDQLRIQTAQQRTDINLKSDEWLDAQSAYGLSYFNGTTGGTPVFKPVSNGELTRYNGCQNRILGLYTEGDGAALFADISGDTTLENIRLSGTMAKGGAVSAALVGTVNGADNAVTNCGVYLDSADYLGKSDKYTWISGGVTGGLVGKVADGGALTITDSFAATVLSASSVSGGLVGRVEDGGALTVRTSYADSYITGPRTGGMVGEGSVEEISDCYAAGFQTATASAAGMVNGTIERASASYTVSSMAGPTVYDVARTGGAQVYRRSDELGDYSITEGMTSSALCAKLSDAFQTSTTGTLAYNLRGQSLDNYIYPRLKVSRHYGDWAAPFQPASLVYFEKYLNNSYGYHGASVTSTLKDTVAVIGDGYGVVFKRGPGEIAPESITFNINGTYDGTIDLNARSYQIVAADGTVYDIYPLPAELVNAAPNGGYGFDPGKYYQKITVTSHTEHNGDIRKTYYFNPHFAKTVGQLANETDNVPKMPEQVGEIVSIRTPRHLYALSKYYDSFYRAATINTIDGQAVTVTFAQERDMDYALYDWTGFANELSRVRWQEPIGRNGGAFVATYDGRCNLITNVSFIAQGAKESNIGMFGLNAGLLANVVITTDYLPSSSERYYVQRTAQIRENETVCMGVLAGHNAGSIQNCAVAGYYIAGTDGMIHAYDNSTLYIGGLVGRNGGLTKDKTATIYNSAADCPSITISSTFANLSVGGFAGWNENNGSIRDCYALGHLETVDVRGGTVRLAGFGGRNDGKINRSYCATSMIATSTTSRHAFAPAGGLVTDCWYLDEGTYSFAGVLRDYSNDHDPNKTSGSPARYEKLSGELRTRTAYASGCRNHPNSTGSYPFRAVVSGRNGAAVHYGDWQIAPQLGTYGVFYWEHEEHGSNDGYRITYVGTADGNLDSNTYLCTAHDDGGAITEYGYGFYVKKGQEAKVSVESSGLAYSGRENYNQTVAEELNKQITGFTFYPYRTRVADDEDYVYLDNGEQQTGTWSLSYDGGDPYVYEITPFFANAIGRRNAPGAILLSANDGDPDHYYDYSKTPGSVENPFEVRSVQQLQYINWNYATQTCTELVFGEKGKPNSGNYKQFPFLQYATQLTKGIQKRDAVEALRPPRTWIQSHDLHGDGAAHTPIAGMATSTPVSNGSYQNILFAWFGGNYDGQSYKIQNLNIKSKAFTVGLFGVTAGADIRNIVMYSSTGEHYVERNTRDAGYNDFDSKVGAYNLGGLIGIAYEYFSKDANFQITNKIENCAIAGYQIIDRSSNQQGAGTANIGGLIGLANVNLNRCSAVTRILLDPTHFNGHMAWGSYIRTGGLAGSAGAPGNKSVAVTNCYTGGSISVSDTALNEQPGLFENGFAIRDKGGVGYSTNIFIAGIVCGSYAPNISNFTDQESNAPDGTANLSNCYTYVELPDLEGTIRAVSYVANKGDRYNRKSAINLTDCFYLKEVNEGITHKPFTYFFKQNSKKAQMSDKDFQDILNGNLKSLTTYLNNQNDNGAKEPNAPIGVTAAQLSNLQMVTGWTDAAGTHMLGDAWGWVTVTEPNGASIEGKFSFSDDPSQVGKNYPFPTILTQRDLTFNRQVNVHYGAWPINSYVWGKARDTLDVFSEMNLSDPIPAEGPYAEKVFRLSYAKAAPVTGTLTFRAEPEGKVQILGYTENATEKCYDVTIRALQEGAVTVTALEDGNALASFILSITGNLHLESNRAEILLFHEEETDLRVTAVSDGTSPIDYTESELGSWSIDCDQTRIGAKLSSALNPSEWTITGYAPGQYTLTVTYTYDYHGSTFTNTLFVPARTLGYIGLSNADASSMQEALRTNDTKTVTGGGFIGDVTPAGKTGSDIFLFATKDDGDLDAFTIDQVTVTEEGSGAPSQDYAVSFFRTVGGLPDIESDDSYSYWGATVRYTGDGEPKTITVTVKLTDANGHGQYILSTQADTATRYTIRFDGKGGSGTMHDLGSNGGDLTLPDCAFTYPGNRFTGWLAGDTLYQPGDTLTVTGPVTLEAQWEAKTYTVHFDPGDGRGQMADLTLTYAGETGEATMLPANAFTGPATAPRFAGWNTERDGRGKGYTDGEWVKNLTTEDEITLYAQWGNYDLILTANGTDSTYLPVNGTSLLALYQAPEKDGWTLDGWYTEASADGVQVLGADGAVVADVAGYTNEGMFALNGPQRLYARWTRNAYVPLAALAADGTDDGAELLIAAVADGSAYLLTNDKDKDTDGSFGSLTVAAISGTFSDEAGAAYTVCLGFDKEQNRAAVWTTRYIDYADEENIPYLKSQYDPARVSYWVTNCKGCYLREHNNNTLAVRTEPYFVNNGIAEYNNRLMWSYIDGVTLQSQYARATSNALGYSGGWAIGSGKTCSFFIEKTIFTFG